MRPHGTQIELEKRRRRALELLGKGMAPPQIASKLDCSLSSVYYWSDLRKKRGDNALKPKPVPGRPRKLPNFHYSMDTILNIWYTRGNLGGPYETSWKTPNTGEAAAPGRPLVETGSHLPLGGPKAKRFLKLRGALASVLPEEGQRRPSLQTPSRTSSASVAFSEKEACAYPGERPPWRPATGRISGR